MRQAGRYLPEFQAVRRDMSFNDLCRTPDMACEVTLQPIRRFGYDAAILFSDILVPLEPMGAPFSFDQGGPRLERPLRSEKDIAALQVVDSRETLGYVAEAVRLIKAELGDRTPLIGFAGSPFTLAAYLVEGGGSQDYLELKTLLYSRPELLAELMNRLTEQVIDFLKMQVEAGVDAVQLFDTWAGVLHPSDYAELVLPRVRRIMEALGESGVPRIYFLKGSAPYLGLIRTLDVEALGLDWTLDLGGTVPSLGGKAAQGNLDPLVLFGTEEEIRRRALKICRQGEAASGHVFNLGHGIHPKTPIAAVETLVETVQGYRKESLAR
jgi:uroporphyrinogen decarboxylase